MLVSLTRGPLHWRRTQQTPPKHWHLFIIMRDSYPVRLVPLWAPSISRTVFIKLGISVIKSDHCSQHNVITWSCYVAWCHGEPPVNRLSIDRRPRPFNAPKKADANRLNPKAGTKSGWFAGPLLRVPARQSVLVCFYRLASAVRSPLHEHICLLLFV
jgi:hypothetical protein